MGGESWKKVYQIPGSQTCGAWKRRGDLPKLPGMPNAKKKEIPKSAIRLASQARRRIRARLLGWYVAEKRGLPWRGEADSYRIWVSEVMLQQTRAETVRLRYPRFLARFPTLAALADAPLEEVLAEWQGLGYYARARNLHRAAAAVLEGSGGALPETREALRHLPGFGPYMAAAVASIAFGERAAALDGNALRVLSRLLDSPAPIDSYAGRAALGAEAEALIPPSRPGDFNQALMDLGARICRPRKPACPACPLEEDCAARGRGRVHLRPVRSGKAPPKEAAMFQLWAERRGAIRLVRRPEGGLFGGMWELPAVMAEGKPPRCPRVALALAGGTWIGPGWAVGKELARVERTLTHRRILFRVFRALPPAEGSGGARKKGDREARWVEMADLPALPLSSAQRAAIEAARKALAAG